MNRDIYETYTDVRSYTKTVDIERTFKIGQLEYSCGFEVSLRFWIDDRFPEIDCISEIQSFNSGGAEVTDRQTFDKLRAFVAMWCRDHTEEIQDAIEKKGNA